MEVWLFVPCLVDQFYPEVGEGMARILARLGCRVHYPPAQTCCGQPAFNTGYWEDARRVARHFLRVFADAPVVVAPSGSCVAMARVFSQRLFHGQPEQEAATALAQRVFEFSEFVVKRLGQDDLGARFEGKVAYHASCHLLRELGVSEEPLRLLRKVRGLELVEMNDAQACCGFGGTFAVKFPELSTAMALYKLEQAQKAGAEYVVMNDISCVLQLQGVIERRGLPLRALHLVHVLSGEGLA
ncbi:MAG: (Fe-S)-binding protein [candidate division KSB1 bacterium]|nr:(Fe-S)-binding protein [candidate division KSB1 bacterium]